MNGMGSGLSPLILNLLKDGRGVVLPPIPFILNLLKDGRNGRRPIPLPHPARLGV